MAIFFAVAFYGRGNAAHVGHIYIRNLLVKIKIAVCKNIFSLCENCFNQAHKIK